MHENQTGDTVVIRYQAFLSDKNNLHTVVWFQVFLSNTNNLYTIIWF